MVVYHSDDFLSMRNANFYVFRDFLLTASRIYDKLNAENGVYCWGKGEFYESNDKS